MYASMHMGASVSKYSNRMCWDKGRIAINNNNSYINANCKIHNYQDCHKGDHRNDICDEANCIVFDYRLNFQSRVGRKSENNSIAMLNEIIVGAGNPFLDVHIVMVISVNTVTIYIIRDHFDL